MLVDIVNRDLPAIHPVTQVALNAVLAAMQVGVAVLALLSDVSEQGIDVALLAGHLGMHASQGIGGLVVIKLRVLADRHPCRRGVAVLARSFQRSVRVRRWHRRGSHAAIAGAERHRTSHKNR